MVVDFYAPWCGPCKMLEPLLDTLSGELDGRVRFARVNVDCAPDLAARYGITGVPTLIIFKNGIILDTLVGIPSPRALRARLEELAPPPAPASAPSAF